MPSTAKLINSCNKSFNDNRENAGIEWGFNFLAPCQFYLLQNSHCLTKLCDTLHLPSGISPKSTNFRMKDFIDLHTKISAYWEEMDPPSGT